VDRKLKRKLAIGGVVLAAFGAAGGAYAVTSGNDNGRDAYLNDLAGRLHVSRDQLNSALKGAFEDRLDAAVKAGKLSQSDADAIKKKVEQSGVVPGLGGPPFAGPGPKGFGPGGPHFGPGFGFGIRAAATDVAKYLGLTPAQLKRQLGSGKSLADIAKAQKKSLDGLKNEIKSAAQTQLDQAVKDKKITQDQADNLLKKLEANLDDLVNAKPGQFKGPRFKGRFKGHFGPQSAPAPPPGGGRFFF
jgi:hypothetical protein